MALYNAGEPFHALDRNGATSILSVAVGIGPGGQFAVPAAAGGIGGTTKFEWQVSVAGTFTALTVVLQGSLDGVNWVTIDTTSSLTGDLRAIASAAVRFLRANVTAFTGGTSVTVSVALGAY